MFEKVTTLFSLFRKGSELADKETWKDRQVAGTLLAGFFVTALQAGKAFGYDLPVDTETITAVAAGIVAVGNVVLTMITSKHSGVGEIPASAPVQIENSWNQDSPS